MKSVFSSLSSVLCFVFFLGLVAADQEVTIQYKHDKSNQDLSNTDFSGQSLDGTNFENSDLTYTKFEGCSLKNCNFQGATLKYTNFVKADVTGSDFRDASIEHPQFFYGTQKSVNFSGLDLRTVDLNNAKLAGANLSKVKGFGDIYKADFTGADLRGANLQDAREHSTMLARFRKAKYDEETRWFAGFDPKDRGLVLVKADDQARGDTAKRTEIAKPNNDSAAMEEEFTALDVNEDGVLSGKETRSCRERDADDDGEVSLVEYLGGGDQ
jgi:uncharacterized protein YjbI with pentapeptide repeats